MLWSGEKVLGYLFTAVGETGPVGMAKLASNSGSFACSTGAQARRTLLMDRSVGRGEGRVG